jgi:CRISPR-associated endoribonuclease Cas6
MLEFGSYRQIGFAGECTYEFATDAPGELKRQVSLLADFAFHAGVGYKTTMGMGQAMRIGVRDPVGPTPRGSRSCGR